METEANAISLRKLENELEREINHLNKVMHITVHQFKDFHTILLAFNGGELRRRSGCAKFLMIIEVNIYKINVWNAQHTIFLIIFLSCVIL